MKNTRKRDTHKAHKCPSKRLKQGLRKEIGSLRKHLVGLEGLPIENNRQAVLMVRGMIEERQRLYRALI